MYIYMVVLYFVYSNRKKNSMMVKMHVCAQIHIWIDHNIDWYIIGGSACGRLTVNPSPPIDLFVHFLIYLCCPQIEDRVLGLLRSYSKLIELII